ncbi:MAG: GNAT family N-acetyltransferase [Candidatus Helarchaeota archaeon]|nr:GNAT family N-acetyltransferase [Candidatus Helarchaeota archaeon]
MKADLTIEPVSEDNFGEFIQLITELAKYEKLEGPDAQATARLKKDGLASNPKYEAYLGILNGVAIGYLIYFMTYSTFLGLPTLYIEDIFILENYRRKGFGQEFLNFCVNQAKLRRCGRVEWTVLTWNEPAIKFYEKNGAKRLGWYFYRLTKEAFTNF